MKPLIDAGADVNAKNVYKGPPPHGAANSLFASAIEKVQKLTDAGADINAKNVYGETPLHGAARVSSPDRTRDTEVVKALIDAGAEVNARNKKGRTPLGVAIQKDSRAIARSLRAAGATE